MSKKNKKSININISKERFLEVYNKHLPNKWTKFFFKYFSRFTENKDLWVMRMVQIILIILFLSGMGGTIFNLGRTFIGTVTYIFSGILILLVGTITSAIVMNNLRIRKIRKELVLTKNEYNYYVNYYDI